MRKGDNAKRHSEHTYWGMGVGGVRSWGLRDKGSEMMEKMGMAWGAGNRRLGVRGSNVG